MKQSKLPSKIRASWDDSNIQRVIAAYESQTEDSATAEDELGVASSETARNVPHELVSQVRQLIAKRRPH